MRRIGLLAALVLLALGGLLFLLYAEPDAPGSVTDPGGSGAPDVPRAATGGGGADPAPGPGDTDAVRQAIADQPDPTVVYRYRVVDRTTRKPIAGAVLREVATGEPVAETDADGRVSVDDRDVTALAFGAAGYLWEFHSPGSEVLAEVERRLGPQGYEVHLFRDDYSFPITFEFFGGDGTAAANVKFRVQGVGQRLPRAEELGAVLLGQHGAPPAVGDAWRRHTLVATLWKFARPPFYHYGATSAHVPFACDRRAEVRFVVSGEYRLDAVSAAGEVARRTVRLSAAVGAPVRVDLGAGASVRGTVVDPAGVALADATVRTEPASLAAESTVTDAGGGFALGPMPAGGVTLAVQHPRFVARTIDAQAGGAAVRVELTPRPTRTWRGRVRAMGDLRPIASARVSLRQYGQIDGEAISADDGSFAVTTALESPELWIEAEGFAEYVELPGWSGVESCDLIPADVDARVRAGLSARLSGTVVGADGAPRTGVRVQLLSERPMNVSGVRGRRIVRGGVLAAPPVAVTDARGHFSLECVTAGPARLVAVDGAAPPTDGLRVGVRLGAHRRDIELKLPR